ncbi:hypothetical protein AXG93_2423s1210 [Marchantia polymorpha subsp. ruderalis]|uniref:Uncharacterized protein n=1 Tax=Marchantia polymorpha subsp. ruderalis TaxID=1480154 RepID=A0A176VQF6_MARPO|nr:hypothetical protein AXG93_2423s1210 [Marchantia polymorpha subsp. ruderalis]
MGERAHSPEPQLSMFLDPEFELPVNTEASIRAALKVLHERRSGAVTGAGSLLSRALKSQCPEHAVSGHRHAIVLSIERRKGVLSEEVQEEGGSQLRTAGLSRRLLPELRVTSESVPLLNIVPGFCAALSRVATLELTFGANYQIPDDVELLSSSRGPFLRFTRGQQRSAEEKPFLCFMRIA